MFILTKISDLVCIPPDQFHRNVKSAILYELNSKFCNKVIPKVGLALAIYDLLECDDGQLKPGDGGSYINVVFRVVVFKPFQGEILTGLVKESNSEGLKVALGNMFEDIFIPKDMMFDGCYYSPEENVWIWNTDPEDESGKVYFDLNEKIRFRVERELFFDVKPKSPKEMENPQAQQQAQSQRLKDGESGQNGTATNEESEKNNTEINQTPPPYSLIASCQTDGMGLVSWWEDA
ncbi:DNA-directed RNA polymerase III subunit rpc25 [Hanseniaspora vineae]